MNINPRRWEEIDRKFFEIIGEIDIDVLLSPINRQSEMTKLIAIYEDGGSYNPHFEYEENPDFRTDELITFSDDLDQLDPVENLYYRLVQTRLGEIQMANTHDPEVVKRYSLLSYGKPSKELLTRAWHNLKTIPREKIDPSLKLFDAETCAGICRKAMLDYGFQWKVTVVKEFAAKAAVDNLTQEFIIRSDVQWSEATLKTMVVHEIGTHILRAANGYEQPLRIFGTGLPNYMLTEEGLAEYTEVQHNCFDPETHRRISARAISADLALNASFWEVFKTIVSYFDPQQAFDIVQRVKIGIADTAEAGAFTKDHFYLEGLARMTEFFSTRPLADKTLLYSGKMSVDEIPLVKTLIADGYLAPPKYLPHFIDKI